MWSYTIFKKNISDEKAFELAIYAGSNDCMSLKNCHEIITKKDDFYKVKNTLMKSVKNLIYSGIEWRANNFIDISKEESKNFENMLELLHEDDDIQKVYHNCKTCIIFINENNWNRSRIKWRNSRFR